MAEGHSVDTTWMWHPHFDEHVQNTAGRFVDFRLRLDIPRDLTALSALDIAITADTRYKLYVNLQSVSYGPVKGDQMQWYSDNVNIGPFLQPGANIITVRVLRFFYATRYATSFPRLPTGGLRITTTDPESPWRQVIQSSSAWYCSIDDAASLRIDEPEDDFLHVYERVVSASGVERLWVPAQTLEFQTSTGNKTPWNLAARQIPKARREPVYVSAVNNIQSNISADTWASVLIGSQERRQPHGKLILAAGTTHQFDIEIANHTTGFIKFCFDRPQAAGSKLYIRYAESYEDKPRLVPYLRTKGDRRDVSRGLYGPEDFYEFEGSSPSTSWPILSDSTADTGSGYEVLKAALAAAEREENYEPFHWRTFRFVRVTIEVGPVELAFRGITMESTCYPLDVSARFGVVDDAFTTSSNATQSLSPAAVDQLWDTSIRTLNNCMHDCYEDCPFYEQLQYAMDTRSSCLFTYYLSADDRLARQAITQLHNSFNSLLGLTASRSPSHATQHIPHFSLYWVCMLSDHFVFYGDSSFARPMLPVADAVLGHFDALLDSVLGLVRVDDRPGMWHFTDWVDEWRPYGIPPDAERTGFSTYTNCLYAYTLRRAAGLARSLGRSGVADEYLVRADNIARAVAEHCFDGAFFTDGLAKSSAVHKQTSHSDRQLGPLYSQHNQVWAVLSSAAAVAVGGDHDAAAEFSQNLLRAALRLDSTSTSNTATHNTPPATSCDSDLLPSPSPALSVSTDESSPPASSLASPSAGALDSFTSSPLSSRCPTPSYSLHPQSVSSSSTIPAQPSARLPPRFIATSISMSHYTFRALSQAGGTLYDDYFRSGMWSPWQAQLALNLTTWEEDSVSQRSDCHAWGSTPLYEFLAEVTGLRPTAMTAVASRSVGNADTAGGATASGGWLSGITFQPRPDLFKKLNASVPLRRTCTGIPAGGDKEKDVADLLVHVSWDSDLELRPSSSSPSPDASKVVRLALENNGTPVGDIPLLVKLPGQSSQSMVLSADKPLKFELTGATAT